ncbi:MAG: VOC family protein [Saccharospirillum sp.]
MQEIKAFVPARDFEVSLSFYLDIGFEIPWRDDRLAYVRYQSCSFLLQNFYVEAHAQNFVMHCLVDDVGDWYAALSGKRLTEVYGSVLSELEDQPWGMREFTLTDPSGVLWRIAQNL